MRWTAAVFALLLAGCVERIITVRSEPPGATVFLDGDRVGETPCDVGYVWYGTRTLTLEKRSYLSVSQSVEFRAPWWQVFPFDLLTDVVIPLTITDRTELQFLLQEEPKERLDPKDVKARAVELREKSKEGGEKK